MHSQFSDRSRIRRATAILAILALTGCGLLFATNPRPDDPNAVQPAEPAGAATWVSVGWQETRWERQAQVSEEQWDAPDALAHTDAGYVAVGTNGNVFHYIGRIWWSADGLDWRIVDSSLLDGLWLVDVAGGPAGFVAVATRGGGPDEPPVAVILGSPDGRAWSELETVDDAWGVAVVARPAGYIVTIEVGEEVELLVSDAAAWARVRAADISLQGTRIADVAADGAGWVAAGSVDDRAVILRSVDGFDWAVEELPAAGPVAGIDHVSAYRVLPGRWATLVLGLDSPPCDDDPSWCPQHQAAWSWTEQTGWARLQRGNRLLGLGHGVNAYLAGDAGFVAWAGEQLVTSPDGWTWSAVPEENRPDGVFVTDALVLDGSLVAVSSLLADDEPGWFGHATILK